jgi:hypothetical protein
MHFNKAEWQVYLCIADLVIENSRYCAAILNWLGMP